MTNPEDVQPDDLSPEAAKAVDEAVERMKREHGYPMPTPAADLLRALHDPLGYWEERAAEAERQRDEARATKDMHKERATQAEARLEAVRRAVEAHPDPCPDATPPTSCGWKRAVIDVRAALDGEHL